MKFKKISLAIFVLLYSFPFSPWAVKEKIKIVTTVFPVFEFAREVVGDRGEAILLLPPGVDVHTWQPRVSDIKKLSSADLFIYIGSELEPWAEDLLRSVSRRPKRVIEMSTEIPALSSSPEEAEPQDPHFWLDLACDLVIIDYIEKILSEIDPEGKNYYRKNADLYQMKIRKLDEKYKQMLANCQQRIFILGGHEAFGFLAKRYNLKQVSLYGLSPDSEPTPQKIVAVMELAKKENIKVIFLEKNAAKKIAKVLSKDLKTKTLFLHPGHNLSRKELKAGVTFLDIMEENLKNLKEGLGCR